MTWPPEGPMSMTFTQLLYIDFTKDSSQKNFDDEKFGELLLKIKEHAQPTLDMTPTIPDNQETQSKATPNVPAGPAKTPTHAGNAQSATSAGKVEQQNSTNDGQKGTESPSFGQDSTVKTPTRAGNAQSASSAAKVEQQNSTNDRQKETESPSSSQDSTPSRKRKSSSVCTLL